MKAAKPFNAFAVYEPNWGEPRPLLTTIRKAEADAIEAARRTEESMTSLYSGASFVCVPPVLGNWERLQGYGYTVRPIVITVAPL